MLSSLTLGFAAGLLLSISPDSGSLEAVNRGIHRGFLSSFYVGLGSVAGDILCYGTFFFGFTPYLERHPFLKLYTFLGCFTLLLGVGLHYLLGSRIAFPWRTKGKVRLIIIWLKNPLLFGLASSLLTPTTLILSAPICGFLAGLGKIFKIELLSGFALGGIFWAIVLALLSVGIGKRLGAYFRNIFSKTAGLFYVLTGLAGAYLALMEMSRIE